MLASPLATNASFGLWIAGYFVLAAIASGLVMRAVVHEWSLSTATGGFGGLRRACFWALPALAGGGLCLILDLAAPSEFWLVLTNFNPRSWIAWGSRILALFAILAASGWILFPRDAAVPRKGVLAPLLLLGGLALSIYPALVLMQGHGNRLWLNPLLPPLFLASALHLGWVLGASWLGIGMQRGRWLVGAEALLFAGFVASSGSLLFPDGSAWGYAAVYVLVGLSPSFLHLTSRGAIHAVTVFAVIGAFAQRAWVLQAGQS